MKCVLAAHVNWIKKEGSAESGTTHTARVVDCLLRHHASSDPFIPQLCFASLQEIVDAVPSLPSSSVLPLTQFFLSQLSDLSNRSKLNAVAVGTATPPHVQHHKESLGITQGEINHRRYTELTGSAAFASLLTLAEKVGEKDGRPFVEALLAETQKETGARVMVLLRLIEHFLHSSFVVASSSSAQP
mgnify:FL=1